MIKIDKKAWIIWAIAVAISFATLEYAGYFNGITLTWALINNFPSALIIGVPIAFAAWWTYHIMKRVKK